MDPQGDSLSIIRGAVKGNMGSRRSRAGSLSQSSLKKKQVGKTWERTHSDLKVAFRLQSAGHFEQKTGGDATSLALY